MNETKDNTGLVLNFALNYGRWAEILEAVKQVVRDVEDGKKDKETFNEETFSSYLKSSGLADPDLLIRTSGEIRFSNFMLWQLAYTEFWFTDVLWPDFGETLFAFLCISYKELKNTRVDSVVMEGSNKCGGKLIFK